MQNMWLVFMNIPTRLLASRQIFQVSQHTHWFRLVKCFNETRSHGPVDQDFDVILIWRFNLPGIEPGIPRSRASINNRSATDVCIRSDRGIPGSIPGR